MHALYAFCRYADDIVDDLGTDVSVEEREAGLWRDFGDRFFADLASAASRTIVVLKAVVHTVKRVGHRSSTASAASCAP